MRMKEPYEAYLDDYDILNVYMSKNFFNGSSRIFHLKDTQDHIIPLTIQSMSDLYNGYTHYRLSINGMINVGEEYTLYDELFVIIHILSKPIDLTMNSFMMEMILDAYMLQL